MIAELVYLLCAITSVACAVLLYRGYRSSHTRLLFWSSLCFGGLALSNVVMFIDLVVVPTAIDLSLVRGGVALCSLGVLLVGLVGESP